MLKPTNNSWETDDAMITPPKDLTLRTTMPYFELKKSPIPAFYHPWVPFTEDEKIMIAFIARILDLYAHKAYRFQDIQAELNTRANLAIRTKTTIQNPKLLIMHERTHYFDFSASPNPSYVDVTVAWLANELITDKEVLRIAQLDQVFQVTHILRSVHKSISSSLRWILFAKEVHDQKAFDIGVIQYPTSENPFIRLHHITLYAWVEQTKFAQGAIKWAKSGIRGEFITHVYELNHEGIGCLNHEQKQKFISAFDEYAKDDLEQMEAESPMSFVSTIAEDDFEVVKITGDYSRVMEADAHVAGNGGYEWEDFYKAADGWC